MSRFIERLLATKGDATNQVIDLIVFLGYFAICLYAGGVAYEASYNDAFQLQVKSSVTDPAVAIGFVTKVLIEGSYWLAASLFLLCFIVIFYACRYVWRPWFGYFLLSLLLYFTFLACGLLGKSVGSADAARDKLKQTTTKPAVKLFGALGETGYGSASFHLLSEDDKWFFVFEPQGVAGSVLEVHAVPKAKVERYEVLVK